MFEALQGCVEARPARSARRADIGRWSDRRRIIQGTGTYDRKVGPPRGIGKELGAALRTEPAGHLVPTVGRLHVRTQRTGNLDGVAREDDVRHTVARDMLTVSTPTDPRGPRLSRNPIAHLTAQAIASSNSHENPFYCEKAGKRPCDSAI